MAGSIGPGPTYSLPTTIGYDKHDVRKIRMPQYSFGARLEQKNKNYTPGPSFNVQDQTRYGRPRVLAYTMAPRTFRQVKSIGPGPANYDLNRSPYVNSTRPPEYSISRRSSIPNKNVAPGPNAYGVKDHLVKPSAPYYSMGTRSGLKEKGGSPGPANYNPGDINITMTAAPKYTMRPRTKLATKSVGPGSNAYNRMQYLPGKAGPAYSFGVRHSPKAPPMITTCDNM